MFESFPKIARLNRNCVITEKLDGTNAAVVITPFNELGLDWNEKSMPPLAISDNGDGNPLYMFAQSRTKLIYPGKEDNYGFAGWVQKNAPELFKLGSGRHFGEWWGAGIQRRYNQKEKKFYLFNTARWNSENIPTCVGVVTILYEGPFSTEAVENVINSLKEKGSATVPGFMDPEGIVIFHTAAGHLYKVTCKDDERPKGQSNA